MQYWILYYAIHFSLISCFFLRAFINNIYIEIIGRTAFLIFYFKLCKLISAILIYATLARPHRESDPDENEISNFSDTLAIILLIISLFFYYK